MLTQQQISEVHKLLRNVIDSEKQLEILRIELTQHTLFSLKPIFQRFDSQRKGYISTGDIMQFCDENQFEVKASEAYFLLRRLDYNGDGVLSFEDFSRAFLPSTDQRQREIIALRDPYFLELNMLLPLVIEEGVLVFIQEMLNHMREQQAIKLNLLNQSDFNVYNVYYFIDRGGRGYIDYQNLSIFEDEMELTQEDYFYLLQAADRDQDARISCIELMEVLMNTDIHEQVEFIEDLESLEMTVQSHRTLQTQREYTRRENTRREQSNRELSNRELSNREQPSREQSKREKSNREQSNRELSNRDSLLEEQSNRESIIQDQSQQEQSQQEQSLKDQSFREQSVSVAKSIEVSHRLSMQSVSSAQKKPPSYRSLEVTKRIGDHQDSKLVLPTIILEEDTVQKAKANQNVHTATTPDRRLMKPTDGSRMRSDGSSVVQGNSDFIRVDNSMTAITNFELPSNQEYSRYVNQLNQAHQVSPLKRKQDQLSKQEISNLLRNLLLKYIQLQRDLEDQKQQLSIRQDFNLLDAFRVFDQQGTGQADMNDLALGIQDLGLRVNESNIKMLLQQYSKQNDVIRYSDFCRMVVPSTQDYATILQNKQPSYKQVTSIEDLFSSTTLRIFVNFIQSLINMEQEVMLRKQEMRRVVEQGFNILDSQKRDFIDIDDLRVFFDLFDVNVSVRELKRLIVRFNGNEYGDGTIALENFQKQFQ